MKIVPIKTWVVILMMPLFYLAPVLAAAPATRPAKQPASVGIKSKNKAAQKTRDDLASDDPVRVSAAVVLCRGVIINGGKNEFGVFEGVDILLQAQQFDAVDSACLASLLAHASNTPWVTKCQRARTLALLGLGKNDQALQAAKGYYNAVRIAQTNDAVNLVATCLAKARPDGEILARRFRNQQSVWADSKYVPATTRPAIATTQPVIDQAGGVGEPILPTIKVEVAPYGDEIDAIITDEYSRYLAKGNLLLLSDQPTDANEMFTCALNLASEKQSAEAIENIARAIRAQNGCVGPAKAYMISNRAKDNAAK